MPTLRTASTPVPIVIFAMERFGARGRSRELATRFATARPVVLLEPPSPAEPGVPDSWDLEFPMRQLLVGRPVLAGSSAAGATSRVPAMVRQLFRWQEVEEWIAWLDAPASFPLARQLAPRLVVYDCAGPAARLPGADTASRKEAELVRAADLLFLDECRADGSSRNGTSWDGLAAHMLRELARAEGARPLRAPEDACTYVA